MQSIGAARAPYESARGLPALSAATLCFIYTFYLMDIISIE